MLIALVDCVLTVSVMLASGNVAVSGRNVLLAGVLTVIFTACFLFFLHCFGLWKVDVPPGAGVSKVRVNVKHDIHGMFHVQSAEMMKQVVKVRTFFFFSTFVFTNFLPKQKKSCYKNPSNISPNLFCNFFFTIFFLEK